MLYTFRLAARSLRERPLRTLLTTFAIVLGVGVILANSITNLTAMDSITVLFSEASGKAHLVVISASTNSQGFPERTLRQVSDAPGVAVAAPSLQVQTMLAEDAFAARTSLALGGLSASGLSLYGIDPLLDVQARDYQIVAGQFLSSDNEAYDVVLVKDYADEQGLRVGSDLEIVVPEGIEQLRVVGLMSKEGPGRLNNGSFGIVPLRTAQRIFGRVGDLDQIDIVATPQASTGPELDALKAALQTQLGDGYSVIYPATRGQRVTQMLDTYQLGLRFFSAVALFVGAFLIYNAFSMTVVERTRETGLLRAVGMTRRQVMRQILIEAGILGVLGSVLGFAFGILLSQGLIRVLKFLRAQDVTLVRVPLDGLAISMLVGVCVTLVAATIPAWQAGRISPLEALRVRGKAQEGWFVRRGWPWGLALMTISYLVIFQIPLSPEMRYQLGVIAVFTLFVGATLLIPLTVGVWERAARPLVRRIYGNEGRLGSSNIQRSKSRTTLTAAALMVGVAMILGVRGLTSAFEHDIRNWIGAFVGGDLYVHSSLPMRADLGQRLETVEGIAAAAPVRHLQVNLLHSDGGDEGVAFMAIDPASYQKVTTFVFSDNQAGAEQLLEQLGAGDTVFVSSVLSEKYGLTPGDTIRLETRRGVQDFAIAAVVVDFYNGGLVVQGSWKDLRRYFGLNDATMFLLKLQPGFAMEDVQNRIVSLYGQRRHLSVDSNEALKTRVLQSSARVFSLFDALALIAIVVAAFGVVNTLTMNVSERTREIGALRGLGMTRWQVSKMILAEAAMIGVIGGVFGLIFGLFMARVFLMGAAELRGYQVTYVLPVQGILVSLLIALVVSQFAAIWPARRAVRLRIVEAIQYE